jgi:hypothetical protein
MRWVSLGLAIAAALSAAAPAVACGGKNVLFHDNFAATDLDKFAKTDPGWAQYDPTTVAIGGGSLKLTPSPGKYAFIYYRGDVYDQAEVCVDTAAAGSSLPNGDAGLIFAADDYVGYYMYWISPKFGTFGVRQWSEKADKFNEAMAAQKVQGLDVKVGAKNTLGAAINGDKATLYLNDKAITQLPISASKLGGIFGLVAGRPDQTPGTWAFQNFSITSLP